MYNRLDVDARDFAQYIGEYFIRSNEIGISRDTFILKDISPDSQLIFIRAYQSMNWALIGNEFVIAPKAARDSWIRVNEIIGKTDSKMAIYVNRSVKRTETMRLSHENGATTYDRGFMENASKVLGATESGMMLLRNDVWAPDVPFFVDKRWFDSKWEVVE